MGNRVTAYMPTLLCNITIYNMRLGKFANRRELLVSMGMPVHASSPAGLCGFNHMLRACGGKRGLSLAEVRNLCGSGMHVGAVGVVLL